jgi:hypothetical protein
LALKQRILYFWWNTPLYFSNAREIVYWVLSFPSSIEKQALECWAPKNYQVGGLCEVWTLETNVFETKTQMKVEFDKNLFLLKAEMAWEASENKHQKEKEKKKRKKEGPSSCSQVANVI